MRVAGKEVMLAVMSPTLSWAPWILLSQLPSHSSPVHLVHNSPLYLGLLSRCTKTSDRKKGCTVVDGKIRKCGWSSLTALRSTALKSSDSRGMGMVVIKIWYILLLKVAMIMMDMHAKVSTAAVRIQPSDTSSSHISHSGNDAFDL